MSTHSETTDTPTGPPAVAWLAWAWVAIPFLYGLYQLLIKIPAVFGG